MRATHIVLLPLSASLQLGQQVIESRLVSWPARPFIKLRCVLIQRAPHGFSCEPVEQDHNRQTFSRNRTMLLQFLYDGTA